MRVMRAGAALLVLAGCPQIATVDSVQRTVGPSGDTVALPGSVDLVIPPGALAETTTITITRTTRAAPDEIVALSPVFEFGPDGLVFAKPVEVTLDCEGTAEDLA